MIGENKKNTMARVVSKWEKLVKFRPKRRYPAAPVQGRREGKEMKLEWQESIRGKGIRELGRIKIQNVGAQALGEIHISRAEKLS